MLHFLLWLSCFLGQADPPVPQFVPLYSERGDHPWDTLHQTLFMRTFTTGESYYHRHSWNVPGSGFLAETNRKNLVKLLDAVESLPRAEMEATSPLRRLIFFRDLWTVFEHLQQPEMISGTRGADLLPQLARIMQRLELTDEEIQHLPDTFAQLREKGIYSETLDPDQLDKPYLPTKLLDESSDWIAVSTSKNSSSAPHHTQSVNQRSLFSIHLRWPAGREAGEVFLAANSLKDEVRFPQGTELALLRRAVAPSQDGKLRVTKVVESLQLLVTPSSDASAGEAKQDLRFKFVLDRASLIAGQPGLVPLDSNSPIDAYGFESTGQWRSMQVNDADGEPLVLGYGKGHVGVPSLQHCATCHGLKTTKFHANFGQFPVYAATNAKLENTLQTAKEQSGSWRVYLELRRKP